MTKFIEMNSAVIKKKNYLLFSKVYHLQFHSRDDIMKVYVRLSIKYPLYRREEKRKKKEARYICLM